MEVIKAQKSDLEILIDLKGERDYYKTMIGCIYGYLSIEDPSYQLMFPQSEYHDDLVTLIFAELDEIKEKLYGKKRRIRRKYRNTSLILMERYILLWKG